MKRAYSYSIVFLIPFLIFFTTSCTEVQSSQENVVTTITGKSIVKDSDVVRKVLDTVAYNKLLREVSNNDTTGKWPAKAPYPLPDAILPFHRIVAFYGNL